MRTSYWEQLLADGCSVPAEPPLDDLTAELVGMLGDGDPHVRNELALSVITTWVAEGVYDSLLAGLGDGLTLGLRSGLGSDRDDSVLRRASSARALAAVVERDNAKQLLPRPTVLVWADRSVSWFTAERDLRSWLPDRGWAYAVTYGADLLRALGSSRHLRTEELAVLIEVIADRLLRPTPYRFRHQEADRLARATMTLLHRDLVPIDTLETWLDRLAGRFADHSLPDPEEPEYPMIMNTADYLRALHLQLLLGVAAGERPLGALGPAAGPPAGHPLVRAVAVPGRPR